MKYVYFALVVLVFCCVYMSYRLGDISGRMACREAQVVAVRDAADATRRIQSSVAATVAHTATADIRRVLREKYTIAD